MLIFFHFSLFHYFFLFLFERMGHAWNICLYAGGSDGRESTCNAGDLVQSMGWEDPEKGMATHFFILALRIPMDRGSWKATVHGIKRVKHDWVTKDSIAHAWKRQWQPTPVLLPGKSHGRRSLVGCSPWGCTESDTTEAT